MSELLLIRGDACQIPLAGKSIHCCITSPPYLGLRSYEGLDPTPWIGGELKLTSFTPPVLIPGPPTWEGLAACEHTWTTTQVSTEIGKGNWAQGTNGRGEVQPGGVAAKREPIRSVAEQATCQRCSAWRGCLGNEPDVPSYLHHLMLICREIWRVLRDDGTLWLNIGDSHAQAKGHGHWESRQGKGDEHGQKITQRWAHQGAEDINYSAGSLLGIPGLFHQAAIADGWVVRQLNTWQKVAPMPESIKGTRYEHARCACVTYARGKLASSHASAQAGNGNAKRDHALDFVPPTVNHVCPTCSGTGRLDTLVLRRGAWRHTSSCESVFMLTKSMGYWSNSEAVREPSTPDMQWRARSGSKRGANGKMDVSRNDQGSLRGEAARDISASGRNPRNVLTAIPTPADHLAALTAWLAQEAPEVLAAYHEAQAQGNPVNILTPKPSSLNMEHYASFPPSLIEPLIKASCPAQCCPVCGAGWSPVLGIEQSWRESAETAQQSYSSGSGNRRIRPNNGGMSRSSYSQHGYAPTCAHYCTCPDPPAVNVYVMQDDGTPQDDTVLTMTHVTIPYPQCPQCHKLAPLCHVPGKCLDPFSGSGTLGVVGRALRRHVALLEASPTYVQLSRDRLGLTALRDWEREWAESAATEPFDDLPLFNGGPTP